MTDLSQLVSIQLQSNVEIKGISQAHI